MKKFGYIIAALGAIAVAAPTIASAETVVIKRGGYHHGYGARAEFREHGHERVGREHGRAECAADRGVAGAGVVRVSMGGRLSNRRSRERSSR